MRQLRIANLLASVALLAFSGYSLWGQIAAGGVAGTVKDPSGAVVRDATLTLTNQATGVVLTTKSTTSGNYVFENVPAGVYTLKAKASGFKSYVMNGIQVHVQNVVTADVPLAIGQVNQAVTVTSAVPLLQAQDASLGQTISGVDVNDLPLNGRNWLSLTQLSAGTYAAKGSSTDSPGQVNANGVAQQQVDYRLNGVDNNIEVFQSGAAGQAGSVAPVPDAIQEFKLQDGNNSAEFGQFSGAVVNAVVKPGTNSLKGDVWEYLRNEAFDANDYFNKRNGTPRQEYRQNQFGGTVGGPVFIPKFYDGRNKTFFFFDYQHTGITKQASFTDTVPTALMHSSNFSNLQDLLAIGGTNTDALGRKFAHGTVFDPATTRQIPATGIDPITGLTGTPGAWIRDPFYNCSASGCPVNNTMIASPLTGIKDFTSPGQEALLNVIPSSRIDPTAVKLLNLLPNPNLASPHFTNNFYVVPPNVSTINQWDLRMDENLTAKDLLWGVFSRSVGNYASYQPFPGVAGGALQIAPDETEPHYEAALHYTHVFSPSMENDITAGYDHVNHDLTMPTADTMGIPGQYGIGGIPQITGNGGLPTFEPHGLTAFGGRRYMPTLQTTTGLQFFDNLMKVHGKHEFHVGFEFNHIRGNIIQPAYSKGDFVFNGQYSDIPNKNSNDVGIADMLIAPSASLINPILSGGEVGIDNLGGMSGYTGSNYAGTRYFADYYAAYFQDNWRLTPSLTLNAGVRWDYSSPYGESDGAQANFQEANGDGVGGIYYMPNKGCAVPRSAAFNALLAQDNITVDCLGGTRVNQAQKTNFAPRIGFAYRLRSNLVLRGGYGVAYGAFDSVGYGGTLGTNYPFQFVISNPPLTSQTPDLLSNGQPATIENTFAVISLQDPSSITGNGLSLYGKQYHYRTPMVQTANLTIQDQFTSRDSIQVGYVGTLGRHLDAYGKQNAPNQILQPGVNEKTILPLQGLNPNMENLATISLSNYNSLQTVYQHQFRSGLQLLANYTFAKCMSDDGGNLSNGFRAEWLPGFGIGPDYALCNNDATHVVHVSGEYALPFGHGRQFLTSSNRIVDAVVGGWNLNYIYTYQSGQPFTIGCPTATTSDFGCNANMVAGQDPYAGGRSVSQWLNPAAFANPAKATVNGQSDYSPLGGEAQQVRGPGFYNLDSSLFKNFTTSRETYLQFRLETFNTLNHAQFNNPGNLNFTNGTFSNITSTRNDGRVVQLAGKFYF